MTSLSSHLDRADLSTLPLPLAQLLRRVQNAKTPHEQHQAAFYFWEASLRLMASVAVAAATETGPPPEMLQERLQVLRRPSLGHWWELLRTLLGSDSEFHDVPLLNGLREALRSKRRTDLPRLAGMNQFLQEALQGRSSTAPVVNLNVLIDSLIQYRNREIGHGALGQKSAGYYQRAAATFAAAGVEFATATGLGRNCPLRFVSDVRLLANRRWQADQFDLSGELPRRKEPYEPRQENGAGPPLPRCIYLVRGAELNGSLLPLYPFLTYDEELQEVAFYNGARRGGLEFLGYTTGDVTRLDVISEALPFGVRTVFQVATGADADTDAGTNVDSAPAPVDHPADDEEEWIGDFQLVSRLDSGGMGIVYRAYQPVLNREVALKCLIATGDPRAEARFTREIQALGRVDHPNLVKIHSSGVSGNRWYYAMELIEGSNVATICDHIAASQAETVDHIEWRRAVERACSDTRAREQPLSAGSSGGNDAAGATDPDSLRPSVIQPFEFQGELPRLGDEHVQRVVRIVRQVADAVHELHNAGIIHRDIKPANVMVTGEDDTPVLMDLGLAQMIDEAEGRLTRTRQFVGTLRYASPEQVLAVDQVTVRSDVYSLGATLWELLTMKPLFGAGAEHSTVALMQQIQFKEPIRPGRHTPAVPGDLDAIVMKCLEKDPDRRYPNSQELARDLKRWERHEVVQAQPLTMRYFAGKYVRRHRRRIALLVASVCVLIAAAIGSIWNINDLRKQAEAARHDAELVSADLALQRGVQLCESGDGGSGLLWLARALELAPDGSALQRVVRINLASWSDQIPQLTACYEHDGWVRCVAFSHDGSLLATGSEDGTVRIWSTVDGELALPPLEHESPVRNIVFSPDNRLLFAGIEHGLLQTWDVRTGQPREAGLEHPGRIRDLALSPDGAMLLTGGDDGRARLWDSDGYTPRGPPLEHGSRINAVAFSGDGQLAATAGHGGLVRVWNVSTREEVGPPLHHDDSVLSVAVSADSRHLVAGTFGGGAHLWTLGGDEPTVRVAKHGGPVRWVAFGSQGEMFITGSWDSTARIWSVETLEQMGPPMQHSSQVYAVALSPDQSIAATGCWDNVARLWRVSRTAAAVRHPAHEGTVRTLAASPNGDFFVTGGEDGRLRVWTVPGFEPRLEIEHVDPVFAAAVSHDGRLIASATQAGEAFVWSADTGRLVTGPLPHDGREIYSVEFSVDNSRLLTGCYDEHVRIWRIATETLELAPMKQAGRVQCVTVEAQTGRFATASWEGYVRFYGPADEPDHLRELQFDSPITWLDSSSREDLLAVATQGGLVHFVDGSGESNGAPLRPDGLAWTVQFHPSLDLVITGTMGGSAQVWDAVTRRPIGVRFAHEGATHAAAFLPGQTAYVAASSDGSLYVCGLPRDVTASTSQLVTWTQVITGMELDRYGVARLLGEQEWQARRAELTELEGAPEFRALE